MFIAKTTDDLLKADSTGEFKNFAVGIFRKFKISKKMVD